MAKTAKAKMREDIERLRTATKALNDARWALTGVEGTEPNAETLRRMARRFRRIRRELEAELRS